jgi:hypothetical protein
MTEAEFHKFPFGGDVDDPCDTPQRFESSEFPGVTWKVIGWEGPSGRGIRSIEGMSESGPLYYHSFHISDSGTLKMLPAAGYPDRK